MFSLVERFTFRVNMTESEMPNPPPAMPQEIQYWAGVIMRNACRKDESRGGIRQCANSESFLSRSSWIRGVVAALSRVIYGRRTARYPGVALV